MRVCVCLCLYVCACLYACVHVGVFVCVVFERIQSDYKHVFNNFKGKLSSENKSVRSPRFSPTGDLVWLQREAQGPHHACHQLVKMAADKVSLYIFKKSQMMCK